VSLNFPKTLMVLLICLTFVGQAIASTVMSYHMMNMKGMGGQEQLHDMSTMDQSAHAMMSNSTSDASEKSTDDCCEKTCNCFTGGCSSVAVLIEDIGNHSIINFSPKIFSVSSLAQSQLLTSLYRPPILS